MTDKEKSPISGKAAAYLAMAEAKYPPVNISESDPSAESSGEAEMTENLSMCDQPRRGPQEGHESGHASACLGGKIISKSNGMGPATQE